MASYLERSPAPTSVISPKAFPARDRDDAGRPRSTLEGGASPGRPPAALSSSTATTATTGGRVGGTPLPETPTSPSVLTLGQVVDKLLSSSNSRSPIPGSRPAALPSSGAVMSASDADDLALEKRRHEDTKQLLTHADERVESLLKDLEARDGEIEGFRVDVRHLKDENEELAARLLSLARVEQDRAYQTERARALEAQLQAGLAELGVARRQLAKSRLEHDGDLVLLQHERDAALAAAAVVAAKDGELQALRAALAGAHGRVAAQERMLAAAAAETRALRTSAFDARRSIEESVAVCGEASLAFTSEVDRLMGSLLSLKLRMAPRPSPGSSSPSPTQP